ncbi:MAG: ribokinase [Prolixibacteraceae bacterium]
MRKIVVVGSSNTDMVVRSQRIPAPGETVLGSEFDIIQGGKGANQAVAAARAGSAVTFIAKVGSDDFGKAAINAYSKDNINTDHIFTDVQQPTGVAIIIVDDTSGQNSIVVAPGSNGQLTSPDIKSVQQIIVGADAVLMQLEIPLETILTVLKIASANKVKTILNPAPAQALSDELLSLVDIITPNESETELITGMSLTNEESIRKAADALLQKINEAVIITLGSRGVYYKTKSGEEAFVATNKVDAVDTTAAGDVFNGYFVSALVNGVSFKAAIALANKAAAISVTRKGAQPSIPYAREV